MSSTSEVAAEPHVLLHAQPERGDHAAVGDRRVGDLLDAVEVAGEAGRDDAATSVVGEHAAQHGADAVSLGE